MVTFFYRQLRTRSSSGSGRRRCLANELADLLELGRARHGAPFEQSGFGGGERAAGRVESLQGDLSIDFESRTEGVDGQIHSEAFIQQIQGGLRDTDVRFDAGQQNLGHPFFRQRLEQVHSPCLDSYGVLRPCLPLAHPEAVVDLRAGDDGAPGRLRPDRLREAISVEFAALRRRRAVDPDYLRRCARCFLKGLCEQCPAKSWSEHGTLDTPVDYLCDVAHEQARDLGLLETGEHAWEITDWESRRERL